MSSLDLPTPRNHNGWWKGGQRRSGFRTRDDLAVTTTIQPWPQAALRKIAVA